MSTIEDNETETYYLAFKEGTVWSFASPAMTMGYVRVVVSNIGCTQGLGSHGPVGQINIGRSIEKAPFGDFRESATPL